jgi:hypothetical protein
MLNNDNYLFDAPMDWDSLQAVIENRMSYLKKTFKTPMSEDEEVYWRDKIINEVTNTRDIQGSVVLPKLPDIQSVIRIMKKYLNGRVVK